MNRTPALLLCALAALSCDPPEATIRDKTCASGCFDAAGSCTSGTTVEACGAAGATCSVCTTGQVCSAGACVADPEADAGFQTQSDGGLEDCSEAAKLVYVIDQNRTLSSFNPALALAGQSPFVDLGRISCPSMTGAEPFSMAVDRQAVAWIIYDSGELFSVNLRQVPLSCQPTGFVPQLGVARFGMGFVANASGATEETLFISGSELNGSLATTKFGTLKTSPPWSVMLRGMLDGAPEITGTGDAKLWAFFPNVSPPRVSQLDKSNGRPIFSFQAPALMGSPRAWAFAFWGGAFWIFLERDNDVATQVWKMNGTTGELARVGYTSSRHIVGAGVSTCAPVEIN